MRQKIIYDAYMSGEPGAIEPPRMKQVNKWVNMAVKNLNTENRVHNHADDHDTTTRELNSKPEVPEEMNTI